jgi:hypothetical protein
MFGHPSTLVLRSLCLREESHDSQMSFGVRPLIQRLDVCSSLLPVLYIVGD